MSIQQTTNMFGESVAVVEMRKCVCQCGCNAEFEQPRIGRVRKYFDDRHKRYAQRVRKVEKQRASQAKAERLLEWMAWADEVSNNGFRETIHPHVEQILHALTHLGPEPEQYMAMLNYMLQSPPER